MPSLSQQSQGSTTSKKSSPSNLITHHLGIVDYHNTWQQMKQFTIERNDNTPDEVWLLQHYPIYTLGRIGKAENLLQKNSAIDCIHIDRGGDITYHGPGQMIAYLLIDIRRANIGIKKFVHLIEQSIIDTLNQLNINSERIKGRPGIYTNQGKIAALGLNCKKRGTYHGVALNVAMDLDPFKAINPCGISQPCIDIQHWHPNIQIDTVTKLWTQQFQTLWHSAQNHHTAPNQ